jgi:hypothetical protein
MCLSLLILLSFFCGPVASTKLEADIQSHQGPEEGSDPEDSRIQVIEGTGGVELRYFYQYTHIPRAG